MTILSIKRDFVGDPNIVRIEDSASYATLSAVGYYATQTAAVEAINYGTFEFVEGDMILINYSDGEGFFTYNSSTYSFIPEAGTAGVTLPTVANDFAIFTNTTGQLADSGKSATDNTKTKVVMLDNPTVTAGNIATFSATDGTLDDSGVAPAAFMPAGAIIGDNVPLTGSGAGPYSFTVPGANSNTVVTGSVVESTAPVSVVACYVTGANTCEVVFSADPGVAPLNFNVIAVLNTPS